MLPPRRFGGVKVGYFDPVNSPIYVISAGNDSLDSILMRVRELKINALDGVDLL